MIAIHSRVMTHLYPYRALVCGKDGAAHALTSKEDARPLWEGKHAQPLEMRHRKATLCQGTVPCEEPDMIVGIAPATHVLACSVVRTQVLNYWLQGGNPLGKWANFGM
eukprot:1136272-Pelagomonas_calceolata.AAC.4